MVSPVGAIIYLWKLSLCCDLPASRRRHSVGQASSAIWPFLTSPVEMLQQSKEAGSCNDPGPSFRGKANKKMQTGNNQTEKQQSED